ncbi:dicer-like protein 1 [Trichodelitschia bisporula]|uniref:Dicer-like protein 1 n=1 Tax=Trichodelitschia bisporula TaxID=703511 RepID=A0A6G1HLB4_9PEZI|nr:dicer-like protein 1 [Trichodelitschia bisporula]
MAKQESVTIADPRDYQIDLFERAKKENTIAVLDTGSGKTLIAVLLLRYTLDKEVEERAAKKTPRMAFFLVDSVTLVFQQFTVLNCNLDHKIDRFCGAMGTDLWNKSVWDKHLRENMAIVCTVEVLHQAMLHSYIKMDQINLLIFDEAHHAKKEHPYARLIRDFYLPADPSTRPRIFGMTASPVDAKVDVVEAARELEQLLDSRIATTPIADTWRNRCQDFVAAYEASTKSPKSTLFKEIESRFAHLDIIRRYAGIALETSESLGTWASDFYWSFALDEDEARKAEMEMERMYSANDKVHQTEKFDAHVAKLRETAGFISQWEFKKCPEVGTPDLSSKVTILYKLLEEHFASSANSRCIVFVERRHTARLLHAIFERLDLPNVRVGVLTGTGKRLGELSITFREQIMTLIQFKKGTLNCIFATSVAEEGLDIPECNLVIRFDLYRSMIQYIQSKGRARAKGSEFIDMVQSGNMVHLKIITDARAAAKTMQEWCLKLPADRLLEANDEESANEFCKGKGKYFRHPKSGATVTYNSSLVVVHHFCSALPLKDQAVAQPPQFVMRAESGKFQCEVILPENSPIRSAIGDPQPRKSLAKRSAAFEMVLKLVEGEYLDEHMMPIYTKSLPAMRNAQLALNSKKTSQYPMRLKPAMWQEGRGTVPTEVCLTMLDFTDGLEREHRPLGFITRKPLPDLPEFPLFLTGGEMTMVKSRKVKERIYVDVANIQLMTSYTLTVFKDLFNKTYEADDANMSYWIVPLHQFGPANAETESLIDWKAMKIVLDNPEGFRWDPSMPNEDFEGKFLVDKWDGGRRFFCDRLAPEFKQTDPVPEEAVSFKHTDNILDYSVSLWKSSRQRKEWTPNQPVFQATQIAHRRNLLARPETRETELRTKAWLCPEPFQISALAPQAATSAYMLPAIIHRIEDYLIALEASQLIGIEVSARLALEACTKDSDNSGDHEEELINFRPGMGNNYERLEFMGDCFLKMATTISLIARYPGDDEYLCHVARMVMLCNKNLFRRAKDLKLYEYARTQAFSRRTWYPEGLKLTFGKGWKSGPAASPTHGLSDKSVADVCEALIGAAFVQHNDQLGWKKENWNDAVKAVKELVDHFDHTMEKWDDYFAAYKPPNYLSLPISASIRELAAIIETKDNYHFNNPLLLRTSFNHPSYPAMWDQMPSYQRLEFLGDSLLDTVCVSYIFYKYPDKDPQWLTEHKMAMVSNKFLGALCVKIGFHKHMRHSHANLPAQINDYVFSVEEAERVSNGAPDYWTHGPLPPKCLPDVLEAYVGAIFVDSGFDFAQVQRFFTTHMLPYFGDMTIYDTFANNHPTLVLRDLLTEKFACSAFRLFAEEPEPIAPGMPSKVVAAVLVHTEVVASGVANSSRVAKMKACLQATEELREVSVPDFRARFGCKCWRDGDLAEAVAELDIGTAV